MVNWSGKNGEIFLRLSGSSVSDSVQVVCVSKISSSCHWLYTY